MNYSIVLAPTCSMPVHASGNVYSTIHTSLLRWCIHTHTNDAWVVVKFLKKLFSCFGSPRAIISDLEAYFCNAQFNKVMKKFGVNHRVATAYHPETSGQVEVTNQELKHILEKVVQHNRKDWSERLDEALMDYRTAYKTSICHTPYHLVYGKECHLLVKLEH